MHKNKPLDLRCATVFIDRQALQHNAKIAQSLSPKAKIMCMIKANAYGHGIVETANTLDKLSDAFGVARTSEAIKLRNHGCTKPIVVLSPHLHPSDLADYAQLNLTPTLYCDHNIKQLATACIKHKINYWLKIDTGMHRLGLSQQISADIFQHAEVVATHFHSADETSSIATANAATDKQVEHFYQVLSDFSNNKQPLTFSLTNSAALLKQNTARNYQHWLHAKLKQFSNHTEIIRPGIMLYGADPLDKPNSISQQLQAVMTFAAPIIDIHKLSCGESVGYSGNWKAARPSIIATVAVGYGDGYPRHAPNGTPVFIHGHKAKLAGNVSMDMIGVDITDLIEQNVSVTVGDSAILWGQYNEGQKLAVETIADHAQTISYALLTGITDRVDHVNH